jgi:hypothetical protein
MFGTTFLFYEKPNLNWGVDAPGLIKKSKQIVK